MSKKRARRGTVSRVRGSVLLGLGLSAALAGCASTRIETQWKEPGLAAKDLAFRRVIALAQLDDETTRRAAEDELVRVLTSSPRAQARSMEASPAYELISTSELGDVAGMRRKVEAAGFDGAVVMRLIASEERVTYMPGRYETMWGRVVSYDPGYTVVDQIVRVETGLYSIRERELLWSGVTRTMNPRDLRDLIEEVARAIGQELEAQGVAP